MANLFSRTVKCRLCNGSFSTKDSRVLISARQDKSMASVMFSSAEKVAITLLGRLNVSINNLSDIRQDVTVCDSCFTTRFLPIAGEYLREQDLKEELLRGVRIGVANNHKIGQIGGVGELGVPEALFVFLEDFNIALQKNIDPGNISWWINRLSERFLREGRLSAADLSTEDQGILVTCLKKEIEENKRSPTSWPRLLNNIETLLASNIVLSPDIHNHVENWQGMAKIYLESGEAGGVVWGLNPDIGRKTAAKVIEAAEKASRWMRA